MMRLSPNPILSGAAWLYTWFFRAVPRIVLLILFGNLGILYGRYEVGLPFDHQLGNLVGIDLDARLFGLDARDHPDRLHGRPARAGPVRGGLHGRDRAGGHEGGRPGPAGGGPRPRHGPRADPAPDRPAPGDAGDRPADRQRDHRDAQGHLAGRLRPGHQRAVLPAPGDRRPHLPGVPDAGRGLPVVPGPDQRADGGPVLRRAVLQQGVRHRTGEGHARRRRMSRHGH